MGETASCICGDGRASGDGNAAFRQPPFADMAPPSPRTAQAVSGTAKAKSKPRSAALRKPPASGGQRSALASLADAVLRDGADPEEMEKALELGRSAGLDVAELEEARQVGMRAVARRRAREQLARAMVCKEEEELRRAVQLADEAMLDSREVEGALALLQDLEAQGLTSADAARRAATTKRLENAIRRRCLQELTEAIREGEAAGFTLKKQRAVLAEARVSLKMLNARRRAAEERRLRESQQDGEVEEGEADAAAGA